MRLDTRIFIAIVVPDADPYGVSLLQGFSQSLIENSWMIKAAIRVPSDVWDPTPLGLSTLIARRRVGQNPIHWFCQTPRALRSHPVPDAGPFLLVFLPSTEDPLAYQTWSEGCGVPPTIVAEKGGDITFSELGQAKLQMRLLAICNALPESVDKESTEEVKKAIQSWTIPNKRPLGYKVGGHNSVAPNLLTLESAGFTKMVYGRFREVGPDIKPYVDQIARTTRSVLEIRNASKSSFGDVAYGATMDLNLFAPSIFPHIFSTSLPADFDRRERHRFVIARRILEKQTGYALTVQTPAQIEVMLGNLEEAKLKQRVTPHALFGIRAEELRLATECVSALAVSELAPVIRLPNEINRSAGAVRNFAASYRSVNSAPRKRLQGFKEVQRRLSRAVPEEFLEFVRGAEVGVRVIADAHLEWLEVDGLPLMFRKSTSRIPVTPGNLFVQTIASPPPLHVTSKDLAHILVLNALDDKDPLRRAFAMALEVFGPQWGDALQFTFCEVRNEEDLVNAFNAFDGAIAIFDGHGGHEANEAAMLYLQGKGVNVWTLKNRITRIPPIILLSACDTHAADRNHATTGNGFLALGARSVLASVFPLDARQAAIFIARLLLRIAQYVPVAPSVLQRPVRWNEVIYGMLQMQIMTDFLLLLQRSGYIDDETLSKAQYRANNAINGGDGPPEPDPFQFMVDYLASLGVELERVSESLQIAVANSNAISYVQLGRPESILIHDEEFLAAWSEFAAGS